MCEAIPEYVIPKKTRGLRSINRSSFLFRQTVERVGLRYPKENCLFGTLTFPQHVTDPKYGKKVLNRVLQRLRSRGIDFVWSMELTQRRRIHYHVLLVVDFDVLAGGLFDAYEFEGRLGQHVPRDPDWWCNEKLREFRAWFGAMVRKCGFGWKMDLEPLKANAVAVGNYLCKDFYKNWSQMEKDEFSRVRLFA